MEYDTHDNGGRPFLVKIVDSFAKVYKRTWDDDNNSFVKHIKTYETQRIFIGRSPLNAMTEFSGAYGPECDGNSILLHLGDLKYVFIGESLYSFTTDYPIIKFISPIGNNDIPYAYAIDKKDNYYLVSRPMLMFPGKNLKPKYKDDPYEWYYKHKLITPLGMEVFLGMKLSDIAISAQPGKEYERLTKITEDIDSEKKIDEKLFNLLYTSCYHKVQYVESSQYIDDLLEKYKLNPDELSDEEFIKAFQNYEFIGDIHYRENTANEDGTMIRVRPYVERSTPSKIVQLKNPFGNYNVLKSMSKTHHDLLTIPEKFNKINYLSVLYDKQLTVLTKEMYIQCIKIASESWYKYRAFNDLEIIHERFC